MNPNSFSRRFLISQYIISASYSLLIIFLILFHKTTSEETFLSGISISRLLAITLPFSVSIIAAYSIRQSLVGTTDPNDIIRYIFSHASRIKTAFIVAAATISIGLLGMALPSYRFGIYAAHYLRIQPLIIWACLFGLQLLFLIHFPRRIVLYKRLYDLLMESRSFLRISFWILVSFILIWILIAKTGAGISGKEDYWYEVGVPILPLQILISVLAGLLFDRVEKKLSATHPLKSDQWIFLGIWLIAALFWGITPVPNSYMNPSPLPPNYEMYPYSDAAEYDSQSQYALIGQGLNNGKSIDNPMYPAFLVIVHLISGQNYKANMAVQAAIYAVFPAIIYLLGKTLFGHSLGISTALMIAFRGYNSIVSASLINLASPKQMLTDFPTAIGIALSILTLIMWVDKERENSLRAIWHGGLIGFTFLIRPTALVVLAITPVIAVFKRFTHVKWLRMVALTLLGFVMIVTPWGIRNSIKGSNPLEIYFNKINLVKKSRFPEILKDKSNWFNKTTEQQVEANKPGNPKTTQYATALKIVLNHYSHNLIGSILILPTSPVFDDLRHTLKSPNKMWTPYWNGDLGRGEIITLIVSLAILAAGIAASWKRHHIIGLAPLMIFLIYQLANSIGHTSGGRYIVPVDWIIIFYFAVGIFKVCRIVFKQPTETTMASATKITLSSQSVIINLSLILILGATPLLIELFLTPRRVSVEQEVLLSDSSFKRILSQSTYNEEEIKIFLQEDNNSVLLMGQAIYPRYFDYHAVNRYIGEGLVRVNFPHIEFSLLGIAKNQEIVLYQRSPVQLLNNTNVFVLGCKLKDINYVDAIAVIVGAPANIIYVREAPPPLKCPLQQPVCDNNGNCN